MTRWPARVSAMWRALRRREQLDAAMHEEMRFHIEMEAERLVRERGISPDDAQRLARVAFGGVARYEEEGRDARGWRWIDAVLLDARLGVRMLAKHRGLTLVGGFAIAVAIAAGATFFEVISEVLDPALPLAHGERVVAIHDLAERPESLATIELVGAFRTAEHNLVLKTAPPEPAKVAEMTASGFVLAHTPPLFGRHLLPADERDGAPPVVVVGYQAWQSRLGGDPQIVGRTISLAGAPHTVVGIMPAGFRFPLDHQFWMPLHARLLDGQSLPAGDVHMFGRLAAGVTLQEAQAELTLIGQRAAAANPAAYERLRPVVRPYTREHLDITHPRIVWALRLAQLLLGALSFVVSVNLAVLMYARTVARLGEIAVRTALGASRRRILAQLFVEALALSLAGAAAGLVLSRVALRRIQALIPSNGSVPFWLDFELSAGTVAFVLGLALLSALVMGVLPGLKATGSNLNTTLRELSGRTGARLGPIWTTLVVGQVAIAVTFLPAAVFMAWQVIRMEVAGPGFAAERFVVGTVALRDGAPRDANRISARQLELVSRLEAEPGVSGVSFSSSIPGFAGDRRIQFDDSVTQPESRTAEVNALDVSVGLFDTYGAEILAGRAFDAGDTGAANAAIVNRAFAQELLASRNPLGVRFRYLRAPEQAGDTAATWYQVIGVVRDFPSFPTASGSEGVPTVYHPAAPGDIHPVVLSVRFNGTAPAGFVGRFREISAGIDPALQLRRVVPLSDFYHELRALWRHLAWGMGLVTASVLLLSAAGIYALTSFAVAQRTREIGIRTALGARPRHLVFSIFGRVMRQLVLGLLAGSLLSAAIFLNVDLSPGRAAGLLLTVAALMLVVGLLAAVGPARRSLRIQASEALRAD